MENSTSLVRPSIHFLYTLCCFAAAAACWLKVPKRIYKSVFRMKSDVSETLHFMIYWKYREYLPSSFSPTHTSHTRFFLSLDRTIHPHSLFPHKYYNSCFSAASCLVMLLLLLLLDVPMYWFKSLSTRREMYLCVTPAILRRTSTTTEEIRKSFLQ